MTPEQYLDHIAADSAQLASAAAAALDQPITFVGDWTVGALVAHLGAVYTGVIGALDPDATSPAAAPEGDAVNPWFAERRTALLAALAAADNDASVETFAGTQTVGWFKRRIASETAVHRWDVDAALNGPDGAEPIDSELAADAIDEYLEVGLRFSSRRPDRIYPTESLHLHRSDGPGEWMLVGDGAGGLTVTHEHGKGDAAVRGPASSLLLWVWGRPAGELQIFGDEAVASTWQALAP